MPIAKPTQWDLVKSIVEQVLTLSGTEKDIYVSAACQNHPNISAEIEELLRFIEESEEEQFMQPVRQDRRELINDLAAELEQHTADNSSIGKAVGPYSITGLLGIGGMGRVYKATRTDGEFHHKVAIKLIKKGIDTEENIWRFRVEREILGALQHLHIAQIYDGSVTDDGTPYLIMEYIEGMPIDRYCNNHQLTISQRLNLFKDVCSAVQFAHTNLIVHRDLKAQNIYVTNEGIDKILDFGVANYWMLTKPKSPLCKRNPGKNCGRRSTLPPNRLRVKSQPRPPIFMHSACCCINC